MVRRRASIAALVLAAATLSLAAHGIASSRSGSTNAAHSTASRHIEVAAPLPSASTGSASASATTPSATATSAPATSAASSSAAGSSAAVTPSATRSVPKDSSPAAIDASLLALFGSASGYSAAAVDLVTGRSIAVGAGSGMTAASAVKLDFLETLLYQHQQSGTELSSAEQANATAMIEQSDNGAADRIWRDAGANAGLGEFNEIAGLTSTAMDPDGYWGLTTTSAADQLILLRNLTSSSSLLTAASRQYVLDLMRSVESDQRWGVSAAADADTATANKNGWLAIDPDDDLWAVNSLGVLTVGGHPVLMAVLSQHDPDFQTGVDRVEQAATELAAGLG